MSINKLNAKEEEFYVLLRRCVAEENCHYSCFILLRCSEFNEGVNEMIGGDCGRKKRVLNIIIKVNFLDRKSLRNFLLQ